MRYTVEMHEFDNGYKSGQTLIVKHDGMTLVEESDGGEPEDQSFYRDWSWVQGALRQAYELGLEDGVSK